MNRNTQSSITIAVASDLHASATTGDGATSHLLIGTTDESPTTHPVEGLKVLIKRELLSAELLLCPGDLGDKAEPQAIRYAWNCLKEVGERLCVKKVVATAGNHDVDSRYSYNGFDAKGILQTLRPLFPIDNAQKFDQYWSRHFALLDHDYYRIVVLNSSAFHGTSEFEFEHGRISGHTLDAIESALTNSDSKPLNILLCHHHPHPHSEIGLGEKDLMKGGQLLLDLLGSGYHGQWLVLHGHKHHPKISYAAGTTASSPVVFAAGSLSAYLYPQLQTRARNQFYLLEFLIDDLNEYGIVGRYRAWDWSVGEGWVPSRKGSGLPASGGFGNRQSHVVLARDIFACSADAPSVPWSEICDKCPSARYILPRDEELIESELKSTHQRRLLRDRDGQIERLEKMT